MLYRSILLLFLLSLSLSSFAQTKPRFVESGRTDKGVQSVPYIFAEVVETQQDTEHRVVVNVSSDFRTVITDKIELKKTAALNNQNFDSSLDALTFLSINGWIFVDQVMTASDRNTERRILVKKAIKPTKKAK